MDVLRAKVTGFDLLFIFGTLMLASTMAGATVFWPLLFIPMLTLHSWLFGYEHLWATYTKLLIHPDDRKRHQTLVFLAPLLVLVGMFFLGNAFGLKGIYVLYFFGQFYHTVRQSWGISQSYRRKAGGISWDSELLSEVTLWSLPIWGLLHRCAQQPDEFLFQDFWLPDVPQSLVQLASFVCLFLWSYWFYLRLVDYKRGRLALGHCLYMFSHLLVFFSAYVLIDELCSGWLLVNVWHNVQYIAFVWIYNRNRFVQGVDPSARVLSWLSQRSFSRAALYFLVTVSLALPIYYLLPALGLALDGVIKNTAVPIAVTMAMSLTFHHYLVDAIIWKRQNITGVDGDKVLEFP